MLLPDVWAYYEYWEDHPPAHEVLYGIFLGLGAKPKAKQSKNTPNNQHGLTREGDADPNALAGIAGPAVPLAQMPANLHEHVRLLVQWQSTGIMPEQLKGPTHAG